MDQTISKAFILVFKALIKMLSIKTIYSDLSTCKVV